MGYAARQVNETAMTIPPDRYEATHFAIRQAEHARENASHGARVDFCNPIARYPGNAGDRIAAVLRDYGFTGTWRDGRGVHVGQWDGGKLGLSWEGVIDAIAVGVDPAERHELVMAGWDDGDLWCEVIHDGTHVRRPATVAVTGEVVAA